MLRKALKIFGWTFLILLVLAGVLLGGFIYKVRYGFPVTYETEAPAIDFPADQTAVLLFSKTSGFRHGESIEAGKAAFAELAERNEWFLYATEEGGVFNPAQLANFDVVVYNNSTGRVLNDEQRAALEDFVLQGGTLLAIHGAGDDSHRWDWYVEHLLGSEFSHHSLHPQLQETTVRLDPTVPDSALTAGLPATWAHTDEWYVFYDNPRDRDFTVLYTIDGTSIDPNGNILFTRDKDFGMGSDHPVAWYRRVGEGVTFYTSLGHTADTWEQAGFLRMIENAVDPPQPLPRGRGF
jgi:type 1 glutamine amidotransferase